MPTRDISEYTGQIQNGLDYDAGPVRDALNTIMSYLATTAGVGLSNSDIATDAAIATTKMIHGAVALNTFLAVAHATDGSMTQVSPGVENLVVQSGATETHQTLITADYITVKNTSGSKHMVGIDEDGDAETISETISIADTNDSMDATDGSAITEAASTTYTLLCLRDIIGTYETKFVYYAGTALDSAFYSTDLAGYNTRMSKAYTHAKLIGKVYNDANKNLEKPCAIGGGSTTNPWHRSPMEMAAGYFSGTGSTNNITGVGFTPTFVMVKNSNTDDQAWYRTYQQGATTYSMAFDASSAVQTAITSIDYDGFTVATHDGANKSGSSIHWLALRTNR